MWEIFHGCLAAKIFNSWSATVQYLNFLRRNAAHPLVFPHFQKCLQDFFSGLPPSIRNGIWWFDRIYSSPHIPGDILSCTVCSAGSVTAPSSPLLGSFYNLYRRSMHITVQVLSRIFLFQPVCSWSWPELSVFQKTPPWPWHNPNCFPSVRHFDMPQSEQMVELNNRRESKAKKVKDLRIGLHT